MPDNNPIFETLFSRKYTGPEHVDQLKDIVAQHPYFSPAQFFLLQKTEPGTPGYETQLIKTNLLFNNPHWLHFQLQQTGTAAGTEKIFIPAETAALSHDAEPVFEMIDEMAGLTEPVTEPEPVFEMPDETIATTDPVLENETVIEIQDEKVAVPESMSDYDQAIEMPNETEAIPDPVMESETDIEKVDEEVAIPGSVIETEPVIEMPDDTEAIPESVMESEIAPMKIELKMPVEKTNTGDEMLFEPMHMVDYFASQGIKLSDEVQMADKLGKQLKSFTEWLKTMKKIHVEQAVETTPETNDSIQILAEGSNTETEVLTESMAEVFIKQGKLGKAWEVYQKLSLLNPAKSAYFAAKLENLKGE